MLSLAAAGSTSGKKQQQQQHCESWLCWSALPSSGCRCGINHGTGWPSPCQQSRTAWKAACHRTQRMPAPRNALKLTYFIDSVLASQLAASSCCQRVLCRRLRSPPAAGAAPVPQCSAASQVPGSLSSERQHLRLPESCLAAEAQCPLQTGTPQPSLGCAALQTANSQLAQG